MQQVWVVHVLALQLPCYERCLSSVLPTSHKQHRWEGPPQPPVGERAPWPVGSVVSFRVLGFVCDVPRAVFPPVRGRRDKLIVVSFCCNSGEGLMLVTRQGDKLLLEGLACSRLTHELSAGWIGKGKV